MHSGSFLFSKWPPTKSAKFQCSLISMKIDIYGYFEVRNWLVMKKIASTCQFYDATVSKMATNKIDKLLMVSEFNENWYLGVFWSEELVGNDEICIQGHFYEATIFKMAANKIVKLSMVSDFNENWYLGVFWSEEFGCRALNSDMGLFGNFCVCIQTQSLLCNLVIIILPLLLLARFCPTKFSETDDPIFTKLHRKVDPHIKRCIQVLEFSKWPPLPWKPWTYVKIFDLTYIGNCQRDFHKTWHIH